MQVSNLLESGKTMFKDLSNELEERLIMWDWKRPLYGSVLYHIYTLIWIFIISRMNRIHKERVEKWQEEIKELRLLDASNEETASLLHNARFLIQNPSIEPWGNNLKTPLKKYY